MTNAMWNDNAIVDDNTIRPSICARTKHTIN